MKTLKDLLSLLRHDMNGVPFVDIPSHLLPAVDILNQMGLVRQDDTLVKPCPVFFSDIDQLKQGQRFPMGVFEACGQQESASKVIAAGNARIVDDPYLGNMVVIN
jgi:hypothetical protein